MTISKLFKIVNGKRNDFIQNLLPSNSNINIGLAIKTEIKSYEKQENNFRKKELKDASHSSSSKKHNNYVVNANIDDDQINEQIKEGVFPVRTLRSFIVFFFSSSSGGTDEWQDHNISHLEAFFKCFIPIPKTGLNTNDKTKCNDLIMELKQSSVTKDFDIKIAEEWKLSVKQNNIIDSIDGVDIINEEFYLKTKNQLSYSKSEFYTAKLDPLCQWHGIINGLDVRRKEYSSIRNVALNIFSKATLKVSAIVHGSGGCGKSTLLRRLAIELRNEEFIVVWVKERKFIDFYTQGLPLIKSNKKVNFLIIIEDWYRLTNEHILESKTFLKDTRSIQNIRLIIGDRIIKDEVRKQLNNLNNEFYLDNSENKDILKEVLEKNPTWKDTANQIFKNDKNYNSTLFLLLFVLARTHEDKLTNTELNLTEPNSAFRNIIAADFKIISTTYPGFAKALFYWGCIYNKNKFYISYDCFLKIADYFSKNTSVSNLLFNLTEGKSKTHTLLRQYINIGISTNRGVKKETVEFLQFNHDTLADLGISKLKNKSLGDYDDIIKKILLEKIISIKDNDTSISALVSHFIKNEPQIFRNNQEALGYVKKIIKAGNKEVSFLNTYIPKSLNEKFALSFIKTLIINNVFPRLFITYQIKEYPKVATLLLSSWIANKKTPSDLLPLTLKRSDDEIIKQEASNIILDDFNLGKTNDITSVTSALKISEDTTKTGKACKIILESPNLLELNFSLIAVALRICPNKRFQYIKAIYFIENSKKYNWEILFQSIKSLELHTELPKPVHDLVNEIIADFNKGVKEYRFLNISQIELHTISNWRQTCEKIINNWESYHRTYISYILYSHRFHPKLTKQVSIEVLENWEREIKFHIKLVYGKKLIGYHVFNALKNPLLDKEFVIQIAKEIIKERDLNGLSVYWLLSETLDNIVNNNIFRTWTPRGLK